MKVKQLEWTEDSYGDFEVAGFWGYFQVVHSESGEGFTASLNDMNDYDGYESEDFPTAEEGKAYCQSLLEKQVVEALAFVEEPKKNKDGCLPAYWGEYPTISAPDNENGDWCIYAFFIVDGEIIKVEKSFGETEQEAIDNWNRRA